MREVGLRLTMGILRALALDDLRFEPLVRVLQLDRTLRDFSVELVARLFQSEFRYFAFLDEPTSYQSRSEELRNIERRPRAAGRPQLRRHEIDLQDDGREHDAQHAGPGAADPSRKHDRHEEE